MSANVVIFLGLLALAVVVVIALFRFGERFRWTFKWPGGPSTILDITRPRTPPTEGQPSSTRPKKKLDSAQAAPAPDRRLPPETSPRTKWLFRYRAKLLISLALVLTCILAPGWWWRRHSEAWKLVMSDHLSEAWVLWKQSPNEPIYYARSGETLHLLTRMFDHYADELGRDVHRTAEVWIIDNYWQYWTTDTFDDYIRANRRFVDSGGKIHRMFILSDEDLRNPGVRLVLRKQCEKTGADVWRGDAALIKSKAEYQIVAHAFQQLPHAEIGFQTFDVVQFQDLLYYSSDFSSDYRVLGGSTWFYGHTLDLKPLFNKSIAQPIDCSAWKVPQVNDAL
jgi:hypothetical protein